MGSGCWGLSLPAGCACWLCGTRPGRAAGDVRPDWTTKGLLSRPHRTCVPVLGQLAGGPEVEGVREGRPCCGKIRSQVPGAPGPDCWRQLSCSPVNTERPDFLLMLRVKETAKLPISEDFSNCPEKGGGEPRPELHTPPPSQSICPGVRLSLCHPPVCGRQAVQGNSPSFLHLRPQSRPQPHTTSLLPLL